MFQFLAPLIEGIGSFGAAAGEAAPAIAEGAGAAAEVGAEATGAGATGAAKGAGFMDSLGKMGSGMIDGTNLDSVMQLFAPKKQSKATISTTTKNPETGELEQTETTAKGDNASLASLLGAMAGDNAGAAVNGQANYTSDPDYYPNTSISASSPIAQWIRRKPFAPWSGKRNG